jgi:uncharacterized phage protein (TIGR02218 family)
MRAAHSMSLISALIARQPMWSADLFTISLPDATTYTWTSADQDIVYSGITFSAKGPAIDRTAWSAKNTTEVPEMTVQIYSNGRDFGDGSLNLKTAAINGLFDGAYLLLQRVFMPTFGDTALGAVTLFGGRFGALEINALGFKATCTASNVVMAQNLPRRTFQASCMHTLYDAACTLNPAGFTDTYTVASANAISVAWVGGALIDPQNYVFGTLQMTSGAGAGQRLTVHAAASFGVAFGYPFVTVPAAGDTFTIKQGCAKTIARCQSFGNILNFGGFPYIPPVAVGL